MRLAAATTGLVLAHVLVADGACRHRARALSENTLLFLSFAHFRHTNNKTPPAHRISRSGGHGRPLKRNGSGTGSATHSQEG